MGGPDRSSKRRKGGDKWRKQQTKGAIESGDSGVFVTCDMGREHKSSMEALDLFSEKVGNIEDDVSKAEDSDAEEDDIETQIRKEMEGLKPKSGDKRLFQEVKMDMPCISFIRLDKSIDPVDLVHSICVDAQENPGKKRSRWIMRLTPVTSIRKTLSVNLEDFAREILKPHFHSGGPPKKVRYPPEKGNMFPKLDLILLTNDYFVAPMPLDLITNSVQYAIRPNVRGNKQLGRDIIIKTVADVVGPDHSVDLKNYDLLILVDVIQNIIGMSVVGGDYDSLKRFNLAELYNPAEKPQESRISEPESKK
ncbi:THUMP domain protein [Paecilomyces variotii No. 5]|uniref:THUMP domain protein n=1 Tax=Byssochlamys spectabilis (strain No. 5 / NBRC 109023) TaxID=1356009 RepID=V5G3U9_BYSSN|nr:THUMP domain protein [Paecilomyces variotii No. 5]